ncbi:MAG TPA: helical backbone metal receptor [Spirochaetota bacterium]|nr:helical backbone metal receptor [Spirochaetota bacterium]HPD77419.1 helical backbone metal receptor [Spirochaetota bacterium]HRS62472.1 helical backbone metal receptor [Spirochaetota bacterium]HRU65999.1 helical backbone metal receptor [Spirochaetota bacterium]
MKNRLLIISSFVVLYLILILLSWIVNYNKTEKPYGYNEFHKVVSLSPSVTRMIFDLEEKERLIGITSNSIDEKCNIEIIGSYVSFDIEKILNLKPDIVITTEDELIVNKANILRYLGINVLVLPSGKDFDSIEQNYITLGSLFNKKDLAIKKISLYREMLHLIKKTQQQGKVAFLVSGNPIIVAGGRSYISKILKDAGAINVFENSDRLYPLITLEALLTKKADAVIVMLNFDANYLRNTLNDFKSVSFIYKNNIFVSDDKNLPYYTPRDYVESVKQISELIKNIKK